jgi:segregation and condensation protein B
MHSIILQFIDWFGVNGDIFPSTQSSGIITGLRLLAVSALSDVAVSKNYRLPNTSQQMQNHEYTDNKVAAPEVSEASTPEPNLVAALECLLFLAEEPLPEEELARLLEIGPEETQEVIRQLARHCESRGLQVANIAGGWQLCTRPEYASFIARMHEPEKVKLSRAAMETLSIIAYRQPVTRPEIEAVRGVAVDGVVLKLLDYSLIEELGRKEAPGRPMLYGTTKDFLVHFGLGSVEDLPQLPAEAEAAAALALEEAEKASAVANDAAVVEDHTEITKDSDDVTNDDRGITESEVMSSMEEDLPPPSESV